MEHWTPLSKGLALIGLLLLIVAGSAYQLICINAAKKRCEELDKKDSVPTPAAGPS
jgi:hypothetical protein